MIRSEKSTSRAFETSAFGFQAVAVLDARTARCSNDECARRTEGGEHYCAACGLERELFWRHTRPSPRGPHTIR